MTVLNVLLNALRFFSVLLQKSSMLVGLSHRQNLPIRAIALSIDPPSSRLLALHCAIAHILHLSAAGDYIDKLLREMDGQGACAADGSTELDRLLRLGLRGTTLYSSLPAEGFNDHQFAALPLCRDESDW